MIFDLENLLLNTMQENQEYKDYHEDMMGKILEYEEQKLEAKKYIDELENKLQSHAKMLNELQNQLINT